MAGSLQLFVTIIFSQDHYDYSYANAIQLPNLYNLQDRRLKHGTISAIGVPNFVQLWTLQILEFLLRISGTSAHLTSTHPVNCPSDRYASATKLVCKNGVISRRQAIFHIKCCSFTIILNPVNYVIKLLLCPSFFVSFVICMFLCHCSMVIVVVRIFLVILLLATKVLIPHFNKQ